MVRLTKDGTRLRVASRWFLRRDHRGQPAAILEIGSDAIAELTA